MNLPKLRKSPGTLSSFLFLNTFYIVIKLFCLLIFRNLSDKLCELKNAIERAVVNRVVEDFIDIATPLKQFSEAVNTPEGLFLN